MLSSSDISSYFKALPRNFTVQINGIDYKCNKLCLIAFSSVFSNQLKKTSCENINSISFNDLLPNISNDKIKTVLEFIHGQESFDHTKFSSFEDIFDYYFIAASFGITIIKNRLCNQLTSLITSDNVSFIFNKISSFPDFYEPLTRFFDNNSASFFQSFIENNILSSNDNSYSSFTFLHSFLENSKNVFQKEDLKLDFIQSIHKKEKNQQTLLLYNCINADKLSFDTLTNVFLKIPVEEGKFIRCFKLISLLINEKTKTLEQLKREKNKLSQLNNDLQDEKDKHSTHQSLVSLSSNRISLALNSEYQIKQDTANIADKIDLLAADVALIPVQNEATVRFLQNVDKMNEISRELDKLMQSFYDNFGWALWPGSSVSTKNDAKAMHDLMTDLEKIVEVFKLDHDLLIVNSQIYANASSILRKALK